MTAPEETPIVGLIRQVVVFLVVIAVAKLVWLMFPDLSPWIGVPLLVLIFAGGTWLNRRWLLSRRARERWPEKDVTCPACGTPIPAYLPGDAALRRRGLYLPDFDLSCPRCGWHGDERQLPRGSVPPG